LTDPLLSVRDLNVRFNVGDHTVHAVRDVSLSVGSGERLGLVGESGCGKTTTLFAIMGLLPPTASVSGRILLGGVDILAQGEASVRAHRWKDIAIVFQGAMNALNPVLTIGKQISEVLEEHQIARGRAARLRARELLDLVQLPAGTVNSYPHELSGGMRQRAVIAMALSCEPQVILADEPTTALDVMIQAQVLQLLLRTSSALGIAIVLVTHDLALVAQTCRRAAVMYAGTLVEEGSLDQLFRAPAHPYTRLLFAATPDLETLQPRISIPGVPPRLDQPLIGCPFHPRCPSAFERCTERAPALLEISSGQRAACHLNDVPVMERRRS
jgi:oligopeptide/dipeptide ABC transporter ATP-binding protein